ALPAPTSTPTVLRAASADLSAPSSLRRLAPSLLRHRRTLIVSVVLALLWAVTVALVPVTQGRVIADAIGGTTPIGPMLALLAGVAVARFVFSAGWRYIGGKTAFGIQNDLRNDVYDRSERLDFTGHAQLQSGQLHSRISRG